VLTLSRAAEALMEPRRVPVSTGDLRPLHDRICAALFESRPGRKVQRIGLYDVVDRIGQSETRTVFLAKHRHIRTRPLTILKVFHFDVGASASEKERQIESIFHDTNAIRLLGAHPNLVDTGDFFAWEADRFVLPTEYVEGGRPLEDWLAEDAERGISFARKADVVAKVARGLAHAHARGVIHRDIRPRNIVLAPGGVVKLVNFDLALIRDHPEVGDPKGLARRLDRRYAAPEVIADPATASERSDIYSLGIVFHELMTGERPYEDGGDFVGCRVQPVDRRRVAEAIRAAGGAGLPRSPEDAASVVERMCRCDPKERYASMAEVKEDLAIIGE
jgi:serine/threonine-protein kinase